MKRCRKIRKIKKLRKKLLESNLRCFRGECRSKIVFMHQKKKYIADYPVWVDVYCCPYCSPIHPNIYYVISRRNKRGYINFLRRRRINEKRS